MAFIFLLHIILLCFNFCYGIFTLASQNEKALSNHKFLIYQTKENSYSLDDQSFNFILIPSEIKSRMLLKAKFPIKSFFEIDSLSPYIFVPEIFCLDCLKEGKISTLKGNIYRGYFTDIDQSKKFLSNIVIQIEEIKYYKDLEPHSLENDIYIALSNITVSEGGRSILIMKKNSANYFDFFQIAKIYFVYETEVESFDFEIGEEIKILNGDRPLQNGGDYSAIIYGEKIIKLIFKEVKSIYCEANGNFSLGKSCFAINKL